MTRHLWIPVFFAIAATACSGKDLCEELPAGFELGVASPPAGSLLVTLALGADRFQRVFEVGSQLDDGRTSLLINLSPAPAADFQIEVTVDAYANTSSSSARLGRATKTFSGKANACNVFEMTIVAEPSDAGVDAGITDSGVPADTGTPPDAEPEDAGVFEDAAAPDAETPDGGGPDMGVDAGAPDADAPDAEEPDVGVDAGEPDTGIVDAGAPDSGLVPFPYVPSNFDPALISMLGAPMVLDCGTTTIDSTLLTIDNDCNNIYSLVTRAQTMGGPVALILAVDRLELVAGNTLRILGSRPVIIVTRTDVLIAGTIDAGGRGEVGGPGSSMTVCTNASGAPGTVGSGGGGGAFRSAGGMGGFSGFNGGGAGGLAVANTATLVPLRGGCLGGDGGSASVLGLGGSGGGALQISAAGALTVTGIITAGGGGGGGGDTGGGGGGGGSGGALLLEGDTIAVEMTADVSSHGGGGGGGGPGTNVSLPGEPGEDATTGVALGGNGGGLQGGTGGNGATGTTGAVFGGDLLSGLIGAGGGGGGNGRVRLNGNTSCTITGTVSPPHTGGGDASCM